MADDLTNLIAATVRNDLHAPVPIPADLIAAAAERAGADE